MISSDSDSDSLPDNLDLDADGDGISDLLEAGGTDSNGDGILDTLTDTDGDGFSDLVDTDNGGTSLALLDTDGDGIRNYQDLDSDNDGVVDNIEGQASALFIAAVGSDTDTDGIDDAYDVDCTPCGGTSGMAIVPVDTEIDGTDDYLDTDTDGDAVLDIIEAHDADLDGFAEWDVNTNMIQDPGEVSSADVDGDGLLDAFDPDFIACSFTAFNQPTNGGCASLQDRDGNGTRDWRDPLSAPLPIELLGFEAIINGNGVDLWWSTASETNNDFFTVERTADLLEWQVVNTQVGAGDSDIVINYQSRDEAPLEGLSFYRLKQTDFDGRFSYSEIQRIYYTPSNIILAFPNPAQNEVMITSGTLIDPSQIQVINNLGQVLKVKSLWVNPKSIRLMTNSLSEGVYRLVINNGSRVDVKSFIILR